MDSLAIKVRISSGALKAALFAQRHPERVARLALDAFVWTGEGSPTLEQRKKRLPEFLKINRRPIDRAFMHSVFDRDHPGTADSRTRIPTHHSGESDGIPQPRHRAPAR